MYKFQIRVRNECRAVPSECLTGNSSISALPTVPTFNSCPKCVGSPGINDCMPDCLPVSLAWMYG